MRLIDADALKNKLCEDCFGDCTRDCYEAHLIKTAPTIQAEPVRRGRWTRFYYREADFSINCSLCDNPVIWRSPYCPNCGAKMDGE